MDKVYEENKKAVYDFLQGAHMNAAELVRIAKQFCCCGTCYYFVQHYTKDGQGLDWGHCDHGNIQRSKKLSTACCGSWREEYDQV